MRSYEILSGPGVECFMLFIAALSSSTVKSLLYQALEEKENETRVWL